MSVWRAVSGAGVVAAIGAAIFSSLVRLPLPFDGFAMLAAGVFAGVGTLALVAWMPRRMVWTDAERLRHAFQARHGVSEYAAGSALDAITQTHGRATQLRGFAKVMREDVAEDVIAVADRLDAAAREIFYDPERHRALRAVLIRSELIEDAARAHAKLRGKNQNETEEISRQKLRAAVSALDAAFDQTDLQAARGLLHDVETASDVAETLLKPRGSLQVTPET